LMVVTFKAASTFLKELNQITAIKISYQKELSPRVHYR